MAKKLNEASANITISDFNTSDFATLARMLDLASQANEDGEMGIDASMGIPNPVPSEDAVPMEPSMELSEPTMFSSETIEPYPEDDFGLEQEGDFSMNEDINRILELSGIKLTESEEDEFDTSNDPELKEAVDENGDDVIDFDGPEAFYHHSEPDNSSDEDSDDFSMEDYMSPEEVASLMSRFHAFRNKHLGNTEQHGEVEEGAVSGALTGAGAGAVEGGIEGAELGTEAGAALGPIGSAVCGAGGAIAGGAIGAVDGAVQGGVAGYAQDKLSNTDDVDEDYMGYGAFGDDEFDMHPDEEISLCDMPEDDSRIIQLSIPASAIQAQLGSHELKPQPVQAPQTQAGFLRDSLNALDEAMYDFNLDEDAQNELSSPGIGDNRLFGPYPNAQAATVDAQKEMPGSLPNREFVILTKPDGIFWQKKSMHEDVENSRPDIEEVDQLDYQGDKHADEKKNMAKNGDNGLVAEAEEDESDDEKEDLAESINRKFAQFMKKNK